jgi:hypothetical protein
MKKFILALCVCLTVLTLVSSAFAEELWDWHLRGSDECLAAGAIAPPGLYFINDSFWTGDWNLYGSNGNAVSGAKGSGYVDVPILLWNPGIAPILGATYACAISQPFMFTNVRLIAVDNLAITGSQWGAYNTVLVPFILSWQLPWNFYVSTSFSIGFDDGTTSPANSLAATTKIDGPVYTFLGQKTTYGIPNNAYLWSSNNNYQFTPDIGLSWLYNGWNVSAEFMYTFYTNDSDCDIASGPELSIDYTLTYTWERWTLGVGAETQNQTYPDKGNMLVDGKAVYGYVPGTMAYNASAGPIVGYNFGPCSLTFTYNFSIATRYDVGGDWALLRLIVPLGNPTDWLK